MVLQGHISTTESEMVCSGLTYRVVEGVLVSRIVMNVDRHGSEGGHFG